MPSRETKVLALLYIVLTISLLIGQEPPAYFENSRDSVDKHDYSIICYPIFFISQLQVISQSDWLIYFGK